jgi:dihydroneopterin aldolase
MSEHDERLSGMVPAQIKVRQQRILIEAIEVMADIGFHAFEVGVPQRLLVSVELWIEPVSAPANDDRWLAWDYVVVVLAVRVLATGRLYNQQDTVVHAIFARIASLHGISALKVTSIKPDVYPDARGVGVEIASFRGAAP